MGEILQKTTCSKLNIYNGLSSLVYDLSKLWQWNPKRLSTKLRECILNNYNNSDYVTKFGRVSMMSLYLAQKEMMETSQIFYHSEIFPEP